MAKAKATAKPIYEVENESKFYNLPTSPATDLVYKTLGTEGDITQLRESEKITRAGIEYTLKESGNKRLIVATKGDTTTTLEIPNIDKLMGSKKGVKKIFLYTLIAINEQAYSIDSKTGEATLRQTFVTFPLQDLVDAGLYKTIQSARVGFKAGVKFLQENFRIGGTVTQTKGKKKTIKQDITTSPFDNTSGIKDGQCIIGLSVNFNFQLLTLYYTILPKWCFALEGVNSLDLLVTIFYLARQNTDKIKKQGYFNINLNTIRSRLGLPTPAEVKNRKYNQYIKKPIEDAITEIEELNKNSDFTITPVYNENGNIKDYLERGYLKIGMKGAYASAFLGVANKKEELKEQAEARTQKIEDAVKIKVIQKAIDKQAKDKANKEESSKAGQQAPKPCDNNPKEQ